MNDTPHTPRPRLTTATEAGPRAGATDADFWALVDGIGRIETVESVETGAAEIAALEALMAAPAAGPRAINPADLPAGLTVHQPGDWAGVAHDTEAVSRLRDLGGFGGLA